MLLPGSAVLFQPLLFCLCEGIIPGVSSALSAANPRDCFVLVSEVGCGDELRI